MTLHATEDARGIGDSTVAAFVASWPAFFDGDIACRGVDPGIFFPPRHDAAAIKAAKAICARCPAESRAACVEYALTPGVRSGWQRSGIYGGLTPGELAKIRKARRAS